MSSELHQECDYEASLLADQNQQLEATIDQLQIEARERAAAFELVEKINGGLQTAIEHLQAENALLRAEIERPGQIRQCPECKTWVSAIAIECPFCEALSTKDTPQFVGIDYGTSESASAYRCTGCNAVWANEPPEHHECGTEKDAEDFPECMHCGQRHSRQGYERCPLPEKESTKNTVSCPFCGRDDIPADAAHTCYRIGTEEVTEKD